MAKVRKLQEPIRRNALLESLRLGIPRVHACAAAKVSEDTFAAEMVADPEFLEAVKDAEAEAVEDAVRTIREAAQKGNWQAAAWFLERRYPQVYGRRTVISGDGDGVPVRFTVNLAKMEAEERE